MVEYDGIYSFPILMLNFRFHETFIFNNKGVGWMNNLCDVFKRNRRIFINELWFGRWGLVYVVKVGLMYK